MNGDAQIAREWAEKVSVRGKITFSVDDETLAVARHILATTTPPTMADVEWDDAVHAGLCAEHEDYGTVRMLDHDHHDGTILCLTSRLRHEWSAECDLTPLPGTRLDLTPRHESEPASTPDHPTVLTSEADYRGAPVGTIVAGDYCDPWVKDDRGFWLVCGDGGGKTSRLMAFAALRVLRWGETL